MVFDKLQSINRKTAAVCVAALLTGFIAGAGYAWSSNKTSPHYNTAKLTSELHYAKVETGRLQCVVLQDKAVMYSAPSGLHGKVIDYLSAGVKLDYIDTVSSQDKDERYAVTEQQLQFRKFFGRRHIIPAGTQYLCCRRTEVAVKPRDVFWLMTRNMTLIFLPICCVFLM